MAFSTKIQGIPRDHGEPIWSVDLVSWWTSKDLVADPRFRQVERSSGYVDHAAVLSVQEAREFARTYRAHGAKNNPIRCRQLDQHLDKDAPETCWVLITVYEWESGFSL